MKFPVRTSDSLEYYHVTEMSLAHNGLGTTNYSSAPVTRPITWDSSAHCHQVAYPFHLAVGVVVGLMAVVCIIGNILVLLTFARFSCLRTTSNIFIINLTVADLIMAVVDFPLLTASSIKGCWVMGYEGCQFYGMSSSVAGLVTINTLAAISFDRYVVVVRRINPRHRMERSTAGIIVLAIWTMSVFWSLLPLTGLSVYRLEGMGTSCTFNYIDRATPYRMFFIALVTFNFFIPLLVILFCYSRIYYMVRNIKREIKLFQTSSPCGIRHRFVLQAEIKTALVAIVIISLFCVAWTPYVIVAFLGLFGDGNAVTPLVSMFPNLFAKFSTASNALIYSVGHPEIRKRVKRCLSLSSHSDEYVRPTSATAGNNNSAGVNSGSNNFQMPVLL